MGPKNNKRPATSPLHQPSPANPSKSSTANLSNSDPSQSSTLSDTDMDQLSAKLDFICSKLESMDSAIHDLRKENSAFREEIAEVRATCTKKDRIISNLTEQVNRLDQAARSNTLRIIGLPITATTPAVDIPNIVFREILTPIIQAAKDNNDLPPSILPIQHFLIDSAFAIPAKKDKPIPVILKLSHSSTRNLIFRHKKAALPTIRDPASNREREGSSLSSRISHHLPTPSSTLSWVTSESSRPGPTTVKFVSRRSTQTKCSESNLYLIRLSP